MKKLEEFIVKAKIKGYATGGEGDEKILGDGSKELTYERDGFEYRDRYFGFSPFIGEEVVQKEGKVIWAMNYYGFVLSKEISAKKIYRFLKKAMSKVNEQTLFRGPKKFVEGNFGYVNKWSGSLKFFKGEEKILYKKKKVYACYYHGGFVK